MNLTEKQQEIIDEFSVYEDWMDKYEYINLPYLWLNFVGCAIVMTLAMIIQSVDNNLRNL